MSGERRSCDWDSLHPGMQKNWSDCPSLGHEKKRKQGHLSYVCFSINHCASLRGGGKAEISQLKGWGLTSSTVIEAIREQCFWTFEAKFLYQQGHGPWGGADCWAQWVQWCQSTSVHPDNPGCLASWGITQNKIYTYFLWYFVQLKGNFHNINKKRLF